MQTASSQCSSLRDAVGQNRPDLIEQLLLARQHEAGQAWADEKAGALRAASMAQDTVMTGMLLTAGADPNSQNPKGMTALHYAASNGHVGLVEILLKAGSDTELKTDQGMTSRDLADQKGHRAVVQALQNHTQASQDVKAFHQAARQGDVQLIHVMLAGGMQADVKCNDGFTALHRAAFKGHEPVARVLLKQGATAGLATPAGVTALHLASEGGHLKVVQLLLMYKADPRAATPEGVTALHLVAKGGHVNVAEHLLTQGIPLDTKNGQGLTALHIAAREGQHSVLQLLLHCGADPNIKCSQGCKPLELAMKGGQTACVRLLQDWADIQKSNAKPVLSITADGEVPSGPAVAKSVPAKQQQQQQQLQQQQPQKQQQLQSQKQQQSAVFLESGKQQQQQQQQQQPTTMSLGIGKLAAANAVHAPWAQASPPDMQQRPAEQSPGELLFAQWTATPAGGVGPILPPTTQTPAAVQAGPLPLSATLSATLSASPPAESYHVPPSDAASHSTMGMASRAYSTLGASGGAYSRPGVSISPYAVSAGQPAAVQQPNPLLRLSQSAAANSAGSPPGSVAAAASSLKAAAAHNGATATAVPLSNLSIRAKAGADSSTAGVEAVPSSPASARSPGSAAISSPKSPAMWQKGVGGVSGQYRIWTAAGLEFKNLLGTAASMARQQGSQQPGMVAVVFHQFSGVAAMLCRAASPIVPGLFVVAMALKELDNIIRRNQATDALTQRIHDTAKNMASWLDEVLPQAAQDLFYGQKLELLIEHFWEVLRDCIEFVENKPSKWSFRRLMTSNDRKQCANTLQKQLSDFVKQLQTAGFVLTVDMHQRTVELGKQVEDCTACLQKQHGAVMDGLQRVQADLEEIKKMLQHSCVQESLSSCTKGQINRIFLNEEHLSFQQQRAVLVDQVLPEVRHQMSISSHGEIDMLK